MGRPMHSQDGDDLARVMHNENISCSRDFLAALTVHHGISPAAEPEVEAEPEPAPAPEEEAAAVMLPCTHKVELIKRAVCKQFNLPRQAIESASRKAHIVRPRQIAMYLVRKHTNHSYAEIGRRLGGRDHTTILHAFHKIGDLVSRDAAMAETVSELEAAIA